MFTNISCAAPLSGVVPTKGYENMSKMKNITKDVLLKAASVAASVAWLPRDAKYFVDNAAKTITVSGRQADWCGVYTDNLLSNHSIAACDHQFMHPPLHCRPAFHGSTIG